MARGPVHADTNGGGGTSFGFGSPLDALLHIFGAREAWCRWCMMPFGKSDPYFTAAIHIFFYAIE